MDSYLRICDLLNCMIWTYNHDWLNDCVKSGLITWVPWLITDTIYDQHFSSSCNGKLRATVILFIFHKIWNIKSYCCLPWCCSLLRYFSAGRLFSSQLKNNTLAFSKYSSLWFLSQKISCEIGPSFRKSRLLCETYKRFFEILLLFKKIERKNP